MFDAHSNFGYSNVAAPAPGLAGTSLTVASGQGALFPAAPFNCTVWPAGVQPTAFNAEIVRVTAIVGDTLTITRTQEGSTPVNIEVGFQIANTTSRKVFTDIEAACVIGAGTQTVTGPFTFVDGNGVTFGMDNGSISASVAPGGGGSINFSAGTTSNNLAAITFANANGITFGLDNGTLSASHNGITSQSNQQLTFFATGNTLISSSGTNNASSIIFAASGNVSIGVVGGSIIVTGQELAASASNGSFTFHTLSFTNAFNVTFGTSAGGIIFASVATAAAGNSVNFSAGTQSSNLGSIVFSNSNGIEFGLNNGTITARDTLALTSQSNQAASASNGSFAFQTLGFSNANGVTFGTSAGSIITASVNTAGAGAGVTLSAWEFPEFPQDMVTAGSSQANAMISPLILPVAISFTNIKQHASFSIQLSSSNVSTTNQFILSRCFGIYSRSVTDSAATNFSNSTAWVSHMTFNNHTIVNLTASSQSHTFDIRWVTDSTGGTTSTSATTNGASPTLTQFAGYQLMNIYQAASLSAGEYIVFNGSRSTAATSLAVIRQSVFNNSIGGNLSISPEFGGASSQSVLPMINCGLMTFSTNSAPDTIALTDVVRLLQCNHLIFQA